MYKVLLPISALLILSASCACPAANDQGTPAETNAAPAYSNTKAAPANKDADTNKTNELHMAFPRGHEYTAEELLTDLRDTRLSLMQIKQQAVNLFMEATRTQVTMHETPLEHTPQEIDLNMIDIKSKYLPPRKEWLVFYMNTLEPIIHLMTQDLKDVEDNGLHAPQFIEGKVKPLLKPWHDELAAINESMDTLQTLIEPDDGTNLPLAKTALKIFTKASAMEHLRFMAEKTCREEFDKTQH